MHMFFTPNLNDGNCSFGIVVDATPPSTCADPIIAPYVSTKTEPKNKTILE